MKSFLLFFVATNVISIANAKTPYELLNKEELQSIVKHQYLSSFTVEQQPIPTSKKQKVVTVAVRKQEVSEPVLEMPMDEENHFAVEEAFNEFKTALAHGTSSEDLKHDFEQFKNDLIEKSKLHGSLSLQQRNDLLSYLQNHLRTTKVHESKIATSIVQILLASQDFRGVEVLKQIIARKVAAI